MSYPTHLNAETIRHLKNIASDGADRIVRSVELLTVAVNNLGEAYAAEVPLTAAAQQSADAYSSLSLRAVHDALTWMWNASHIDTHADTNPDTWAGDDVRQLIHGAAVRAGLGEAWRLMEGWQPEPPAVPAPATAPEPEPFRHPGGGSIVADFLGYVDREGSLRWVNPSAVADGDVPVGWRPLYVGEPIRP